MLYLKNFRLVLFFLVALFIFNSCSIKQYGSTPKRAENYPKFEESDYLKGSLSSLRSKFDIKYYDLSLDFDLDEKTIIGSVEATFEVLETIDTLQFDLFENMNIDSIILNGKDLSFYRKFNTVFILLKNSIESTKTETISIYYNGKPIDAVKPPWDGGFVRKKDKNKKPWISVACEEIGASLWWPLKDHLSDEPDSMKLSFTIPKDLYCVSNGNLIDIFVKGDQKTYVWKTSYSINSYNATFYIGDFKHFSNDYKSGYTDFTLDYYVLPYNLEKAKTHFKQVDDILSFYETKFGAYPWPKDGFKLVESPFAGMEHQTAIAYGNGYKNTYLWDFDYIILHEIAHEWWGNAVSANDYADIWIHEGFATYSEALYVEHVYGYDSYLKYLDYEEFNVKNKQPIVRIKDVNYWNHNDNDVYGKGSLVLHTLREYLDDDSLFFDIISSFYNENKYKIVSTQNFIDLVNAKTNEDLSWFFNQYLYDRRVPILKMNIYFGFDSYEFIAHWENVNSDFRLPVEIIDEHGFFKRIMVTTKKQKFNNGDYYPYLSDRERSYFKFEIDKK